MKGDQRKERKKTMKAVKKNIQAAEHVKYTQQELEHDRKQYIEQRTVQKVQEAEKMVDLLRTLSYHKAVLDYRQVQLKLAEKEDKFSWIVDYDSKQMVKSVFLEEFNITVRAYNKNLNDYVRVKEKFETVYGFTQEQMLDILNQKFDWVKWQNETVENEYKKDKAKRQKSTPEIKRVKA